jgi:hypothetical protein
MTKRDKIQHLLISLLLEEGQVSLNLPDGMSLDIGIVKENEKGELVKDNNYCWLIASQKNRDVCIDSYNFSLKFQDDSGRIIMEDSPETVDGVKKRSFTII